MMMLDIAIVNLSDGLPSVPYTEEYFAELEAIELGKMAAVADEVIE